MNKVKPKKISNGVKKILILSLAIFGLFFYSNKALAVDVEFDIDFGDPNIKNRYAGSVVIANNPFAEQYWYIEPETKEKLLIKNGVTFSRLLKNFSQEISAEDLNKIAIDADSTNVDYNLTHQLKGQFVKNKDQSWYINPLDGYRYQIKNGQEGFDVLKNLALDISVDRLADITQSDNPNFSTDEIEVDFSIYESTIDALNQQYYRPEALNNKDIFYGSIKGLVKSLDDPYTEFFTPNNKSDFDDRIEGEVEGIGAMVETVDGVLTVISPLNNTPAEKAGLLPQDQIWYVDTVDIRGYLINDATRLIKGPVNTPVLLGIYRPADDDFFQVTITRQKITIPYVSGKKLDNNIAYIKIDMFSLNAGQKFAEEVSANIDNKTKGVILDLRNNPGGYTGAAFDIADFWLDPGDIIFQEKYPGQTYTFRDSRNKEINLPTVVLVNNGSASASEIVTSALKNHEAATIIGQQTFGKGTGQTFRAFSDGSAIKYTIFEWLDSNDNNIDGQGIVPDYIVQNTPVQDKQLQKAKDLLR